MEKLVDLNFAYKFNAFRTTALLNELKYLWPKLIINFNWLESNNKIEWEYEIIFSTIQAINITTIDSSMQTQFLQTIFCEIIDSDWITRLKEDTFEIDDVFYNKSRHFRLMFYDEIIEIIAYDVELVKL